MPLMRLVTNEPAPWIASSSPFAKFLTLALPYFRSEDKWLCARLLLAGVIAAELGLVYVAVTLIQWNARFFNALEARDWVAFQRELVMFGFITLGAIVATASQYFFGQNLIIRWRRWLTERYVAIWISQGSLLLAALCRQHGRQHPSAHRERRAPVSATHPRARHRAAQQRGRAVLLCVHLVGAIRDDAAAGLRLGPVLPRLSGLHRARLCGHRHAGRRI